MLGLQKSEQSELLTLGTMFTVNISAEFMLAGRAQRLLTAFQHRG